MISVGVWLKIQSDEFEAAVDTEQILYGPYLIMAAGCAIIIVAIVGMFGACCDRKFNRVLLFLYIVLVIVIFIAQTIGGILAFTYREEVFNFVRDGLNETLADYGQNFTSTDERITDAWDYVQEQLECCGINNYTDWAIVPTVDEYPESCCSGGVRPSSDIPEPPCSLDNVYRDGCEDALTDSIRMNLLVVASIGITFIVAEVIVVLMAVCLLCCTDFDDE